MASRRKGATIPTYHVFLFSGFSHLTSARGEKFSLVLDEEGAGAAAAQPRRAATKAIRTMMADLVLLPSHLSSKLGSAGYARPRQGRL